MIKTALAPSLTILSSSQNSELDDIETGSSENPAGVVGDVVPGPLPQNVHLLRYAMVLGFLLFCASTAIQPSLNSIAVGDYLSTGSKCDVGDLECYIEPKGSIPGLNIAFGVMGLLANTAIAYVFLPLAHKTLSDMWNKFECSKSINGAVFFACAAAAVSYQLSRDSFQLGDDQPFWPVINAILILLAVVPTFASRFRGSQQMLNKAWRIKPQVAAFPSYFHITDDDLAWAIAAQNDFARNVFAIPSAVLLNIENNLLNSHYHEAMTLLYQGSISGDAWQGLSVTPWRSAIYWSLQAAFFNLSLLSSCIIYNVISGFTKELAPGLAQVSTLFLTLPATLYYIYSLCRLPDAMFRAHVLASRIGSLQVWSLYAVVYVVALGSCGNLLYSGMTQGLNGDFAWLRISPEFAKVAFGLVGALISSLCNLFALLDIFEQLVITNSDCAQASKKCADEMNRFVKETRARSNVTSNNTTTNPIQDGGADLHSREHLIERPVKMATDLVKSFYKNKSFFAKDNKDSTAAVLTPTGYQLVA